MRVAVRASAPPAVICMLDRQATGYPRHSQAGQGMRPRIRPGDLIRDDFRVECLMRGLRAPATPLQAYGVRVWIARGRLVEHLSLSITHDGARHIVAGGDVVVQTVSEPGGVHSAI